MRFDQGVQTQIQTFTADGAGAATLTFSGVYGTVGRMSFINTSVNDTAWSATFTDSDGIFLSGGAFTNNNTTFIPTFPIGAGLMVERMSVNGNLNVNVLNVGAGEMGSFRIYYHPNTQNHFEQGGMQ